MTAATEQIFANNFWGLKDDGYHVLTAKMSNNKKTFEEIKSFYNFRATLHEEFGRKLMKHAKNGIGREEIGTLHGLLKSAHEEMERTAQTHIDLSQKLKNKLEVELNNFILDQKDKKKLTSINAEKSYRFKLSSETYLSKVKEKYESEYAKLLTLQTQVENVSGREAEKLKQKIERTQHEVRVQEQEYKNACRKSADATAAWNKTWKSACDTYQVMEKQRLEFIHHSFSMYINMLSTATSQDTESYERFWKALDNYDAAKDIQSFIQIKSTGAKMPEAEVFVDYMDDPAKTFQQHTVANFPVPAELISPTTEQLLELNLNEAPQETPSPLESVADPVTPTDSVSSTETIPLTKPVERKPSILRSIIKPLPSLSTPVVRQKSQRNSIKKPVEQAPVVPVLAVPDSPSTTDISDEEVSATNEEEELTIDPRAKVMFAIGNNMFDLGHLDTKKDDITRRNSILKPGRNATTVRRMGSRRRRPSADLEAAVNFSYQSLFEELGVYDKREDNRKVEKKVLNQPVVSDMSGAELRRRVTARRQQPKNTADTYQSTDHNGYTTVQQEVCVPAQNIDSYVQPRQQQQSHNHYQQPQVSYYHHQLYTNQNTVQDPSMNHVYSSNHPTYHNAPNSTVPTVLYWVIAIADWYSGKPEELQFSRGTLFGVTEVRPNGWYYAIKFDSRLNSLTNEKGYIAQNMVQLYS